MIGQWLGRLCGIDGHQVTLFVGAFCGLGLVAYRLNKDAEPAVAHLIVDPAGEAFLQLCNPCLVLFNKVVTLQTSEQMVRDSL